MWRKLTEIDIRLGLVVRFDNAKAAFDDCVIVAIDEELGEPTIHLARPYVYASAHFSTKQPMVGCEVFAVSVKRALSEEHFFQALEGKRGKVDVRAVKAA